MAEVKRSELCYMSGSEEVRLTPATVKSYLVRGNGAVSDQEVMMFMGLCKANKLNPFANDAYLIKYGDFPAAMVMSINALMKRADTFETYDGFSAGVIVRNEETNAVEKRCGSAVYEGEKLLAGWAEVYRNDRTHPYESVVDYEDAVVTSKNGNPNSQWQKRPGMMIRKTALARALREAFPNDFGNTYSEEESADIEATAKQEEASRQVIDPINAVEKKEQHVLEQKEPEEQPFDNYEQVELEDLR